MLKNLYKYYIKKYIFYNKKNYIIYYIYILYMYLKTNLNINYL